MVKGQRGCNTVISRSFGGKGLGENNMSTFEKLTILAAFSGLILSLINTGIIVYKEYFKRVSLEIEVEEAFIREVTEGLYDIQINFICNSNHEDIYFRNAKLVSPYEAFGSCMNMTTDMEIRSLLELNSKNLIKYNKKEYVDKIKELFTKDSLELIKVRDYKLEGKSQKSFTIADRVETSRWPDGWEDLKYNGWKFEIHHNNGKSECLFDFEEI